MVFKIDNKVDVSVTGKKLPNIKEIDKIKSMGENIMQCDSMGSQAPQILFLGRKGHKNIHFDMFDQDNQNTNNYNRLVSVEAGSGMSFFTNSKAFKEYESNQSSHLAQEEFEKNDNIKR